MRHLLFLLVAAPAAAQGRGELELQRLQTPIELDGRVTDAEWGLVAPLPLTMFSPVFNGTPSERSEIRVAYDDHYLYASGRFLDARPDELRINSLTRDRWSGDETFVLLLDPYNDNETGLWFYLNPAGVRFDNSISDDGNTWSDSWNGMWDAATQVGSDGWYAEVRIPLSTLRFQDVDGRVVMGLTVSRLMARTNERVTFPSIDPRYNFRSPSVMQDVVLRGITPRRPVYLTPYVTSGATRIARLPAGAAAYQTDRGLANEIGGDLRYGLSDNLNLDLTINTDFAQVEADDAQLNLTRFPLFFPEKRQFFQERAGVFSFDFGSGGRLFHSRQIGLAPDRTPLRMLGGARIVGRAGGWDLAALDVQTGRRDQIPAENLGVLRVRRRVLNEFSYAGAVVTTRLAEGGGYNVATGLDAQVRVFGNDYLTLRGASTFDDADSAAGVLDRSQVHLNWNRRSSRGLTYNLQYHRAGPQYRPELGFLPRPDFTRFQLYAEQYALPESGMLRSHGPGFVGIWHWGNTSKELESYYLAYWWRFAFPSGANGWLQVTHLYEDVPTAFPLGKGASVQPDIHRFANIWFFYQAGTGALMRTGFEGRLGTFYDGWRATATLTPTWNVSRHLELGGSYEWNQIRFPGRAGLDAHIARLRVGTAANAKLSMVGLVQLNSVDDKLGANFRLRYNVREGSDLWLVYDEGIFTERDQADPSLPRRPWSDSRALRLKVTHTFTL